MAQDAKTNAKAQSIAAVRKVSDCVTLIQNKTPTYIRWINGAFRDKSIPQLWYVE